MGRRLGVASIFGLGPMLITSMLHGTAHMILYNVWLTARPRHPMRLDQHSDVRADVTIADVVSLADYGKGQPDQQGQYGTPQRSHNMVVARPGDVHASGRGCRALPLTVLLLIIGGVNLIGIYTVAVTLAERGPKYGVVFCALPFLL